MNCVPIYMLPTQCHSSLLPEQGISVEVYFTSEHLFMDLRCATSSRTRGLELRTAVLTAEMFAVQISGLSAHGTHSAYSRKPEGATVRE